MGFNYGYEWKKFTEEQKKLAKQYKAAGMSETAIQKLYEDALAWFHSRRKEARHSVNPMKMITQDPETGDYRYMDMDEFPAEQPLVRYGSRYSWIDEISNPELHNAIVAMKPDYIEIITLMMEGYFQCDIAKIMHVDNAVICRKVTRIKKTLNNFLQKVNF